MFEAYRVAVKISLINEVSAGVLLIAKQFGMADTAAKAFHARVNAIKDTMKGGAFMAAGGAAIAAPFIYAIDKAAELQKQLIGVQIATRGTTAEMDAMRRSIEGIAGQTVFSNVEVARIAKMISTGTTFSASQVAGMLPAYTRFADVQMMMKGTGYQESVPELLRLAHTAQKYTPEAIAKYADLLTKASFVVPGGLGEIGNALKYSQGVGKQVLGVDDDSMVLTVALLNQMGLKGSRGGTNLIAAMTRTIPGIFGSGLLKGKSNEALRAMGMVDAQGHSTVFNAQGNFDTFMWLGRLSEYTTRAMATMPAALARQQIMTNMQHAFGTQGARVASLLANPQAIELLNLIGARFAKAGGVEEIQGRFANEAVAQQWMNAKTNFVSAMTELGMTLLPLASRALKGLNTELQGLIRWITENQGKTKALAYGFLTLSGAMAIGGTLTMLSAGFRGLGLVMGTAGAFGSIAKVIGLVGAVGTGGTLLFALAGVAAAIGAIVALTPDKPDDGKNHTGSHWERVARGGHWVSDHRSQGRGSHAEHWVKEGNGLGQGHWELDIPGKRTQPATINNTIVLPNGRVLAEVVTHEMARDAGRPPASTSNFDGRVALRPVAGH